MIKVGGSGGVRVLCPSNSDGHTETRPVFNKVKSHLKDQRSLGSNSLPLVKVSSLTCYHYTTEASDIGCKKHLITLL